MTSQRAAEPGWHIFEGTIPVGAWLNARNLTNAGDLVIDFGAGAKLARIEEPTAITVTSPEPTELAVRGRYVLGDE